MSPNFLVENTPLKRKHKSQLQVHSTLFTIFWAINTFYSIMNEESIYTAVEFYLSKPVGKRPTHTK